MAAQLFDRPGEGFHVQRRQGSPQSAGVQLQRKLVRGYALLKFPYNSRTFAGIAILNRYFNYFCAHAFFLAAEPLSAWSVNGISCSYSLNHGAELAPARESIIAQAASMSNGAYDCERQAFHVAQRTKGITRLVIYIFAQRPLPCGLKPRPRQVKSFSEAPPCNIRPLRGIDG